MKRGVKPSEIRELVGGTLTVYHLALEAKQHVFEHKGSVYICNFSPNGELLAVGGRDKNLTNIRLTTQYLLSERTVPTLKQLPFLMKKRVGSAKRLIHYYVKRLRNKQESLCYTSRRRHETKRRTEREWQF